MLRDKSVPKRKKAVVVFGVIYLLSPIQVIPPVLFPVGQLDSLVLWIWILWYLKDELDKYWLGEKQQDYSKKFRNKTVIHDVDYEIKDKKDEK